MPATMRQIVACTDGLQYVMDAPSPPQVTQRHSTVRVGSREGRATGRPKRSLQRDTGTGGIGEGLAHWPPLAAGTCGPQAWEGPVCCTWGSGRNQRGEERSNDGGNPSATKALRR